METNKEFLKAFVREREANSKSKNTIKQDKKILRLLLEYTNNKPLKEINEADTQGFIGRLKTIGAKKTYGNKLVLFFRWLHKLDKRTRSDNMRWLEYPSIDTQVKNSDPDKEKYLIIDEEYIKIIQYCKEKPKWSALFETLFLSGGRPDEVNSMKYKDIKKLASEGLITLRKSKTIPRIICLMGNPEQLTRWSELHPTKDPEDPLFPSMSGRAYFKHMGTLSINAKFESIKKHTGIKESLTPHCFRKTRATIMFSSRDPIFDDGEIAKYFGWKPHTVTLRREEYDLRTEKDLQQKIRGIVPKSEDFDVIKAERDKLEKIEENYEIKIFKMERQINEMDKTISLLFDSFPKKDSSKKRRRKFFHDVKI